MDLLPWQQLLEPDAAPLIAAAAALADPERPSPAQVTALRRHGEAPLVAAALELVAARRRAAAKYPDPERLLVDREGVEQASGAAEAGWKARRFASASPTEILDLCCGIGGDAMALAAVAPVVAVDRNPVRTLMCGHNAGCTVRTADLDELDPQGRLFHLDPGRRAGGRRRHRYADYEPDPDAIARWAEGAAGGAVKLGPGVELDLLPPGEVEILGGRGGLLQAVLWCGILARPGAVRTATRLEGERTFTAAPAPIPTLAPGVGACLYLPDPVLERADLVGARLGAGGPGELATGLGLLSGDPGWDDPWFTPYRVVADLPWRPRRIRKWLAAHDGGVVTVKTRGGAVDAGKAQKELRGRGDTPYVVWGLRLGTRVVALITEPRSHIHNPE